MLSAEEPEPPRPEAPVRSCDDVAVRPPGRDADMAVAVLYDTHYRPLTRLAALLAADEAIAEEIVRDAFVAMHGAWRLLRDGDRALRYLQGAVVRRSRSRQAPAQPGPGLVAALRSLPVPQREALVLRYYADLPEARIAAVMGISSQAVSGHIARGMSAMQAILRPD